MTVLWPFDPDAEFDEGFSWQTDVLPSYSAEMRYSNREAWQTLSYQFRLDATEAAQAGGLVASNALGNWYVPLWGEASRAGDVSSADTVISCNTDAPFEDGGQVLLWEGRDSYVLAEIASIGSGSITLSASVGQDLTDVRVLPVWSGDAFDGIEDTRAYANLVNAEMTFTIELPDTSTSTPWPQYLDLDVITDPSYSFAPLSGRVYAAHSVVGTISRAPVALRDFVERRYAFNAQQEGVTERKTWRQWFHSIRGKETPFWLSTRGRELITASIGAADTTFDVDPVLPDVADYVGKHVSIDNMVFREITAASVSGSKHRLTIAATGQAFTDPEVCFLRKFRLDTDLIEFAHINERSTVDCVVLEVPEASIPALPTGLGLSDVALMANFEGADGATTYTEESIFAEAMSFGTAGDGDEIDTARARFGGSSYKSSSWGGDNFASNIDWDNPVGVTLEGFVYPTAVSNFGQGGSIFQIETGNDAGGCELVIRKNGDLQMNLRESNGTLNTWDVTPTPDALTEQWSFFEVRIDFVLLKTFVYWGGVLMIDEVIGAKPSGGSGLSLSLMNSRGGGSSNDIVAGNMDNVRFTNGLTTTPGTVPTTKMRPTFTETRV